VCNLYNLTTTRDAVMEFTRAFVDKAGWNEPSFDVYPKTLAPVVRVGTDGKREIVSATWGMPTPPIYLKGNNPEDGAGLRGRPAREEAPWCRPGDRRENATLGHRNRRGPRCVVPE